MHIYYDIVEDANVHAGYYTSSHDHVNVCELMATILWQASRSVGYNFAAKLGPANDKCYGWRCPCKRPQVHDLLSQLGGVHSHSIDEEHYYDADGNHYGSWQLHQLPLPRLKDVVAIRAFGLDSGAQLNTVLDLSLPKRHTTQASIVHPPPLAPPSPHKVMEAVEEPPFGDRGHVRAPTLARSTNRKELYNEIKRHFTREGRTFSLMSNSSRNFKYKCDGCALTFAMSLCTSKTNKRDFNTWGLTKSSIDQSWEVCPTIPLQMQRFMSTTSPSSLCCVCIIACRVMHSNEAVHEGLAARRRKCFEHDLVSWKQGFCIEKCCSHCQLC